MRSKYTKYFSLVIVILLFLVACGSNAIDETKDLNNNEENNSPENTPIPKLTDLPTAMATPEFPPGYEEILAFAGSWEGEWRNITFGSSGPMTLECLPEMDGIVTCTVDIGGMVFGMVDPVPQTYTLSYDHEGVKFEILSDPVFGEIKGEMLFNGEVSAIAEIIPDPGIASMTSSGLWAHESFKGTQITFGNGGGAEGEIELHKVSE